jgi:integrase
MLNGGVPVSIVSGILGHANPSITLGVYSHLVETEKQIAKNFWDKKNHA